MHLIADRFWTSESHETIDLATGARVELVIGTAGGPSDHAQWFERCARFARLRHRVLAPLVDFGPLGDGKRFEAWHADGGWRGSRETSARVAALAHRVLAATGRTSSGADDDRVRTLADRPVVIPGVADGYPSTPGDADEGPAPGDFPIDALGLAALEHSGVQAIAESFADDRVSHPRTLCLWGGAGSGIGRAVAQLAAAAQRHGFVPVSTGAIRPGLLGALKGRSICFIARADPQDALRLLVEWSSRACRPHVVLFAGEHDVPGVRAIPLDRFAADTLVRSVQPAQWAAAHQPRVQAAVRRAQGMPGRFAACLWPDAPVGARHLSLVKASESRSVYGEPPSEPPVRGRSHAPGRLWPATTELLALRKGLDEAIADLTRGRQARGDRSVRHLASCLARRGDWHEASRGWLSLAVSLRQRGRLAEAQAALDEVRQLAAHLADGATAVIVRAAIVSGSISIDGLRLTEGETVLRAAGHAAAGLGDGALGASAALALSRALFWSGRYEEGSRLLHAHADRACEGDVLGFAIERSRFAVGRNDLAEAVAEATRAATLAATSGDAAQVARAAYASAFAHLAVDDAPAVAADAGRAIDAARRARQPLLGFAARLLAAERARRSGDRAGSARVVRRLKTLKATSLPPLLRARADFLADLLSADDGRSSIERHQKATGLAALRLFVPAAVLGTTRGPAEDVVRILQVCQTASDGASVLNALCRDLRSRLRAAAVGFWLEERGTPSLVTADGSRLDATMAARIHSSLHPIVPHAVHGTAEGGVPVRYGGRTIGALAVRWVVGESAEPGAIDLLTTAAVAAAPALSEVIARRTRPPAGISAEILGVSRAVDEVRGAIERAAAAPFAVLIEGESGSGKELVARALHRRGGRRERAYCTLNCAALPDDLVESELFGHARGAFTGAMSEKPGVFEEAHLGTLFLDEVGELSPRAQAKVLRTIQDGEFRRLGENTTRRVDVRLVTATNRDLRSEVRAGRFRLDLLYRLDVIRIVVPPLRDRPEDIPVLADHFWRDAMQRLAGSATLGAPVLVALARYDWPGNIRELQNVLSALAVRCPRRGVVPASALPQNIVPVDSARSWRLDDARRGFDAHFVRAALVRSGGHRARAAAELGVTRQGLAKLIARLRLAAEE